MIDGFQIAAAVTSYDGNPNSIEDPEIGVVKFYLKQWGLDDSPGITFKEVKTRQCTYQDFNWGRFFDGSSNTKFFPVNEVSVRDLKTFSSKMKCLDDESTRIFGSYNTDKASNLMVVFEKCDSSK